MSPSMPKEECHHEKGKDRVEPKAIAEASGDGVNRGWKKKIKGSCSENGVILPASQADIEKGQGKVQMMNFVYNLCLKIDAEER
jgi:hypothetical protein